MRISDWSSDVCSSDLVRSAWKRRRIVPNRTAWRQTLSSPAHPAPSKGELPMSRLPLVDPGATTAERKAVLDQIHGAFGATPNMFKAVANSPAALRMMWGAFGALGGGTLSPKVGEQDRKSTRLNSSH